VALAALSAIYTFDLSPQALTNRADHIDAPLKHARAHRKSDEASGILTETTRPGRG